MTEVLRWNLDSPRGRRWFVLAEDFDALAARIAELEADRDAADLARRTAMKLVEAAEEDADAAHARADRLAALLKESREHIEFMVGIIEGEGMPGDYTDVHALLARLEEG
jgi:hypothetical protein